MFKILIQFPENIGIDKFCFEISLKFANDINLADMLLNYLLAPPHFQKRLEEQVS